MGIDASKSVSRFRSLLKAKREQFRRLVCEGLERRELMAVDGPRLLSIAPNSGEIFSSSSANVLNESPRELVLRFDTPVDPTTLAGGIRISRSGGDLLFGPTSPITDQIVSPAFLSFEDPLNPRVVVARFSQPLPDDLYRVEVFGVDVPSQGITGIRDTTTGRQLLKPRIVGQTSDVVDFDLELGTKIIGIVPQPIDRLPNGTLSQRSTDIEVYFNDAELYNQPIFTGALTPNPKVVDPQFYNLTFTKDTVSPNDDELFRPTNITYDPVTRKAVLTFAQSIEMLPQTPGSGTFRLRIGSNAAVANVLSPATVPVVAVPTDPAGVLSGARDLGTVVGSFSTILAEQVRAVNPLLLDFPGSVFEPGHRDVQDQTHLNGTTDASPTIAQLRYTFMDGIPYGTDIAGRPVFSSISPEQKQRAREVFEFYSAQLGLDFVEYIGPTVVGDGIFKVVVGDLAPNSGVSGPGGVIGLAGGDLAIMDGAEAWDNSFGDGSNLPGTQNFFGTTLHEVGHLLGLGHTYELPPGTVMGSEGRLARPGNPLEQIFPGDHDVVHGQHLFRPDNRDVDLYRFVVANGTRGEFVAETIAERLNSSSNVDTYLTLFKREADGTLSIVAANNNYFSDDSLVRATLEAGEYFVSVTGKGNEDNSPLIADSGSGAVSEGAYQLRIDFKSTSATHLAEERAGSTSVGSALDGDGDGRAGGNFDFWFRAAAPQSASNPAVRTLFVDKVFAGVTRDGSLAAPFNRISEATAVARPGDIIRLVGDTRTPNILTDDAAYEIGDVGGSVGVLGDGATLEVPRGVTLMIDAGAILKFGGSKILVGSSDSTRDRSGAAIQVLGLPGNPVYFTAYQDESLGRDTNPLTTTPSPGNWGGIEIRNDFDRSEGRFDREREGIFLNTIANADMRFGGGLVGVGANASVVSPIHLAEARPLIMQNRIVRSGDSAVSADPNSFEETLIYGTDGTKAVAPSFRITTRIGPDIRSNTLLDNSVNGLFVRIDTLSRCRTEDTECSWSNQ
jgi:large repetitive protein